MPKNKGKGGKNRRRGKNESEEKRELTTKTAGQEYGQVIRMLGNGRLEAFCFDGKNRQCHIRGKMRKRQWVNQGDIVLLGLREFQDDKADVILKYNADESRRLKRMGHLPNNIKIEDDENRNQESDLPFEFADRVGGEDSAEEEDVDVGSQPASRFGLPSSETESETESSSGSDGSVDLGKLTR